MNYFGLFIAFLLNNCSANKTGKFPPMHYGRLRSRIFRSGYVRKLLGHLRPRNLTAIYVRETLGAFLIAKLSRRLG